MGNEVVEEAGGEDEGGEPAGEAWIDGGKCTAEGGGDP